MSTSEAAAPPQAEAGAGMFQYLFEMVQGNGLSALVEKFHAQGLGDVISSWVGKGENLPINAEQLKSVLNPEHIADLASKLGISREAVVSQLSGVLPDLIDKLTPNGQLPNEGVVEHGLGVLKGMLSGFLGPQRPAETSAEETQI